MFFREFGAYSLDLETRCYLNVTRYDDYLKVKEEMLLGINAILAAEGAEIAFPTTQVDLSGTLKQTQ